MVASRPLYNQNDLTWFSSAGAVDDCWRTCAAAVNVSGGLGRRSRRAVSPDGAAASRQAARARTNASVRRRLRVMSASPRKGVVGEVLESVYHDTAYSEKWYSWAATTRSAGSLLDDILDHLAPWYQTASCCANWLSSSFTCPSPLKSGFAFAYQSVSCAG